MRRKIDRLDAVVTLLSIISVTVVMLITMMLTGCMTAKGLHQENSRRNASVKWQQLKEHGQHYVL